MTTYQERVYPKIGVMLLVKTLLILLCFVSVSQAQLQNFLTALTTSDSGATVLGNPSGNTSPKSVFFHLATVTDSIMSSLQNYGKQDGNYADFNAAFNAAASDTASLIISKRHAIISDTTIFGMTDIVVRQGGRFNISSGTTLTFADSVSFWAGDYQVFEGAGTVAGLKRANPLWWGATGDGVTLDSTAFSQAMASLTGGGVFDIPRGTYIFKDYSLQVKSNVLVQGAGIGNTILKQTKKPVTVGAPAQSGIITVNVDSSIMIRDLEILGTAADNQAYDEFGHGILIFGGTNIWVQNVKITNMPGDGIIVAKQSKVNKSIFIENCVISIPGVASDTLVGRNAISVTGGSDIWIVDNHILDGNNPGGIDIEPTAPDSIQNVHILNNIITSPGSASIGVGILIIETTEAATVKRIFVEGNDVSNYNIGIRTTRPDSLIFIKNNHVYKNTTDGIHISGSDNIVIEGNYLYANTNNGLHATTKQSNLQIRNNYAYLNGTAGFILAGTSGNELHQIILTGNVAYDNSQTTDNNSAGFDINFVDSLVMKDNISYVNLATGNDQKWGFLFQNCDKILFQDNISWNNQSGETFQSGNTDFTNWGNRLGWEGTGALIVPAAFNVTADSGALTLTANTTLALLARGSNVITFKTNSFERMRIDSGGNLGVGTTTPVGVLSVEKSSSTDTLLFFSNNTVSSAFDSSFIMLPNGNIGFGTNAPSRDLHINSGTNNTGILLVSTDGDAIIEFSDNSASGNPPYIGGRGDDIIIGRTSTIRMILTNGGNVGINTTNPGDRFVVVANDTMAYGGFQTAAYVSSANQDAFWFDPGGDTLFVKNDGTVRYILTTAYTGSGH